VKLRVLFLCASNSVQSPMAESLLKALDSEHFEVASAGIEGGDIHPLTVEVMKEIGIDLQGRATKTTKDVVDLGFDLVITLCHRSRYECPPFPGAELVHWQLDDPLTAPDHAKQKRMFQSLRDQIAQRVRLFALVQVRFAASDKRAHHDPRTQRDVVHS
jgi:protein-tyrosine-phosphatase